MILDTRTLFVILTLVTVFMSCAMFFFWIIQKTYTGFTEWVITAFLAAVLYVLLFFRGSIPDLFSIFIANAGIPAVLILRLQGTRKFFSRPSISPLYLMIPSVLILAFIYFLYFENNVRMRTFLLTLSVCFLISVIAREFFLNRHKGSVRLNITVFMLNVIYSMLFLWRGISILKDVDYRFMMNTQAETVFFVFAPIFEIAWNVCFIMLNSQRTEEELQRAFIFAEEANRAKSSFLGVMSHEMRTPLHAIIGTVGLLVESGLKGKQKQYAGLLRRSSNLLQDLLDEALDITLIEAGKMELNKSPIKIKDLLDELNDLFGVQFEAKKIDFLVKYPEEESLHIVCDRHRLLQVLANLVENSFKYTPAGKVEVSCSITRNSETPTIQFMVTDTGIGIVPERLLTIFEPFSHFSESDYRHPGGIGLGLSIVKNICKLMGGSIHVESEPSRGSTFVVKLPLCEVLSESIESSNTVSLSSTLPHMSILAVDDVPENLELLRFYIEGSQAVLTETSTGEEAIEKLSLQNFDCMLLDIQLPGISGIDIVKTIREKEKRYSLNPMPVIGISANAYEKGKMEALTAGCNEFLSKPFSRQELFRIILAVTISRDVNQGMPASVELPLEMTDRARLRIRQYADEIIEACKEGDFFKAERLSHSIKGLGRTFGIDSAAAIGEQMQSAAGKGDGGKILLHAYELIRMKDPD